MRQLATAARIRRLLQELGKSTREPATICLTGGATAVLLGWRDATIDVDVKLVPDRDEVLRAIRDLKMIARGLVRAGELWDYLDAVEPQLHRYPAVDGASLRRALERVVGPRPL